MKRVHILLTILISLFALTTARAQQPYMLVLGTAQDGGYPHLGCEKECCNIAWENPALKRFVVSLALVIPESGEWVLFEATPDMADQIQYFKELTNGQFNYLPDAIFVSHAHIGHYTGLMEMGREAMNTNSVPVYALPRMADFLKNNGPWSQLIELNNISLIELKEESELILGDGIDIRAFTVPHRDEYSETAGYRISAGGKRYLFIPDINKWDVWEKEIIKEVKDVDFAFIDGTFYSSDELPGRDMDEIPHPFIVETMQLFTNESEQTKRKIKFIHLNHSNPAISSLAVVNEIERKGYSIARQGFRY